MKTISLSSIFFLVIFASLASSCSDQSKLLNAQSDESTGLAGIVRSSDHLLETNTDIIELRPAPNPERNAYFGDLHVHTAYSFDAFQFGTLATPADAYRYAKGESIQHPSGFAMQLRQPLDFYAVTDHAIFMGVVQEAANTNTELSKFGLTKPIHNLNDPDNMGESSVLKRSKSFTTFIPDFLTAVLNGEIKQDMVIDITKRTWLKAITAADEAYIPGVFTTFAAYEYTSSTDQRGNLHRNVIFNNTNKLPAVPFSRLNSKNPEGLWDWMDNLRQQGIESLAIPHNSNGSNGQMFKLTNWAGDPIDDNYAKQRLRNEPLVEITQVKGTSDTHPSLSRNDEWANFEIAPYRVGTKLYSEPVGGYVRDAYLRGLKMQENNVTNPYKFGLIGSSDTHTGATSVQESNFFSKAGIIDGSARMRGSVPISPLYGAVLKFMAPEVLTSVGEEDYMEVSSFEYWSASGLAAVWAEENTREAIYAAFRRKETFATTGPRIKLRFFASFDFPENILELNNGIGLAYQNGVAMGSDLKQTTLKTDVPSFLVIGMADPNGTPLQRLQIIKGTVENNEHIEKIYDITCSDGLSVNKQTHRCPDNGAKVNIDDCSISTDKGDSQLTANWQDPDFDPNQKAFYYVRALENPSCRWSTWDAIKAGTAPRSDLPKTIQERAWSSPIWYLPKS